MMIPQICPKLVLKPQGHVFSGTWLETDVHFWPRGFADAVLGTAYLLLFLENLFWIPRKKLTFPALHCKQTSVSTKFVDIIAVCLRNLWTSLHCVHEINGIYKVSTKLVDWRSMNSLSWHSECQKQDRTHLFLS